MTPYNLSTSEVADMLASTPQTVKRWVREGKLAAFVTPGGWYRFRQTDVDAFLEAGRSETVA